MADRDTSVFYWQGLLSLYVPTRALQEENATRNIHSMSSKHFLDSHFENLNCMESFAWF